MLPKTDRIRLQHMLDASREAISYAQGRTRDDLAVDSMLARALVKCIEIVGEAALRVSQETRERASLYSLGLDFRGHAKPVDPCLFRH